MKEPVRVLLVVKCMNRGGLETTIMNAYRLIDKKKLQFDFIVHTEEKCAYDKEILELGGKIYSLPHYNGLNHLAYIKAWDNFFKKHKEYKLIHGHLMSTAAIYLKIAKKHGLKTISHSHTTSFGKDFAAIIKNLMRLQILNYADYLFACSTPAGQWLFGLNVINNANFKVIPNGIDTSEYSFNPKIRQEVRDELGIDDSIVIGHVGSLDKAKNHKFLISVFNKLNDKEHNIVLLLVGNGRLRKKIISQIGKYGLTDKVIMTGTRNDVNRLLQAMDIFIFPSHFEGFPTAVTEAQVAGLSCIVSDSVPSEVRITDLVEFVSLDQSVDIWADKIIIKLKNRERSDKSEEIFRAGYDVRPIAQWYEQFYLENSMKV